MSVQPPSAHSRPPDVRHQPTQRCGGLRSSGRHAFQVRGERPTALDLDSQVSQLGSWSYASICPIEGSAPGSSSSAVSSAVRCLRAICRPFLPSGLFCSSGL